MIDFSGLSQRGYFIEGLPNTFTTVEFGAWVNKQKKDYRELEKVSRLCGYSSSKRNGQRRVFSVPNPQAQFNIQIFFEKHDKDIFKLASGSAKSLSHPEQSEGRCVKITPHAKLSLDRFIKLSAYKFIAYVDISRFYHSIYTHSLPWAAHGKSNAKSDRKSDSKTVFFNRIDHILRNSQDGQTFGIPVGPDSSRVLAEVINAAVDEAFLIEFPNADFVRHVDDVWIGANSYDEAKMFLQGYREQLFEFELDINESKTSIRQNHIDVSESWPHEIDDKIKDFLDSDSQESRARALLYLIQTSFDQSERKQDQAQIRYLIRQLDSKNVWNSADHWEVLESFLMQCALHAPHTIDYVARIVSWRAIIKKDIKLALWSQVIESLLNEHTRLRNDSEVLWLLWLCFHALIKVPKQIAEQVIAMKSDFCVIMLFVLNEQKLVTGGMLIAAVLSKFDLTDMLGKNWLLAHEVRLNDWIPAKQLSESSDALLLAELRKQKISFLDKSKLPPVFYTSDGKLIEDPNEIVSAIEAFDSDYDDIDATSLFSDLTAEDADTTDF